MNKRILFLLACFTGFTLTGLCQWNVLTSGTSSDLKDVFFTDANTGWVVGKSGSIRKTGNAGLSWTSQTSGTSEELKGVHFADANTGWAVGKEGVVLKTVNGGSTWISKANPASDDLSAVSFYGMGTGVAVGKDGTIISTADGGETWTLRNAGFSGDLYAVQFVSASVAFVCGQNGSLLKTTDAGTTWSTLSSSGMYDFINLHFVSENKGYLVPESEGSEGGSEGTLYAYTNGNLTVLTLPTSKQLRAVYFISENLGWAVGDEGRILRTTNGGTDWTAHTLSSVDRELASVYFVSAQTGYAVGEDGTVLKYGANPGAIDESKEAVGSVYPNPFTDRLYLTFPKGMDKVQLKVMDITGRVCGEWTTQQDIFTLETDTWKPGIYLLQWTVGNQSHSFKTVKHD